MSLYNVAIETVRASGVGGTARELAVEQITATKHEIIDGTLYLYTEDGGVIHYSKYYWRKVEKIE
jgi:hypothetical protein